MDDDHVMALINRRTDNIKCCEIVIIKVPRRVQLDTAF